MKRSLLGFVGDDTGQDLIEYALLTSVIGLVAVATWDLIVAAIQNTYASWNTGTNNLWETPDPGAGS
jgi:Flp pilus assembly pilin Flp